MIRFVRKPEFAQKRDEWKHVKCCKMVKKTTWFNATAATNNSGNCLPFLLNVLNLNYCAVVATYSILVYVR